MTKYSGVERRSGEEHGAQFVVVKSWHTTIIVITMLVSVILAYATLRDGNDENSRRIHDLEQRPTVTREVYDVGQRSLEERLKRIEDKLDSQDFVKDRSISVQTGKKGRQ